MQTKTKVMLGLGSAIVVTAAAATTASVLIHNHKHEHKTEETHVIINKAPEVYIIPEDEATHLYAELKHQGASDGRANMLINELNQGHITYAQLKNIIKTWRVSAEHE